MNIGCSKNIAGSKLAGKGVPSAQHALIAEAIGADGIIVSNHGGRPFDGAIAPIDALPAIIDATPNLNVMIDGGFRRGTDILKARALGARFVFVGRAALYGLAAAGEQGAAHAQALLQREIDVNLALLGCPETALLSRDFIRMQPA